MSSKEDQILKALERRKIDGWMITLLALAVTSLMSMGVLYYKVDENTAFRKQQGKVAINFVNMTNALNILNNREIPALTMKVGVLKAELRELEGGVSILSDDADTQFLDLNYRVNNLNQKVRDVLQSYKDYLNARNFSSNG